MHHWELCDAPLLLSPAHKLHNHFKPKLKFTWDLVRSLVLISNLKLKTTGFPWELFSKTDLIIDWLIESRLKCIWVEDCGNPYIHISIVLTKQCYVKLDIVAFHCKMLHMYVKITPLNWKWVFINLLNWCIFQQYYIYNIVLMVSCILQSAELSVSLCNVYGKNM